MVTKRLANCPLDLGRLLREMLDTYPELQVAQQNVKIQSDLPLVMANEATMTQYLSNLLGNAVKFTQPVTSRSGPEWHCPDHRLHPNPIGNGSYFPWLLRFVENSSSLLQPVKP